MPGVVNKDQEFEAMDREDALNIVRRYKDEIRPMFGEAKVFLFGSYAKGNARPESDIDVAVIVREYGGDWLKRSSALWRATLNIDTAIEPVLIREGDRSPLYEDIMRTGIAV